MKKLNLLGIIGALISAAAGWLPWVKIEVSGLSETITGFPGGYGPQPGALCVLLGVFSLIFACIPKRWSKYVTMVFFILNMGWGVLQVSKMHEVGEGATTGFGLYALILAAILGIAGCIMGLKKKPTV